MHFPGRLLEQTQELSMEPVSLPWFMQRLSSELIALSDATERMHSLVEAAAETKRDDPNFVRTAQSIDSTRQMQEELAALLDRVATMMPPDWNLQLDEALSEIRLGDLRLRLGGSGSPAEFREAGEVHFF